MVCLSAGFFGYLIAPAAGWQRLALICVAFVLIKPGLLTDAIGASIIAVVLVGQIMQRRELVRVSQRDF